MRNPWLDFASYQYSDRSRFKGREEDIAKFSSIMANGTMSVLYADSGIGKTSFINAGIDPILIDKGYFPIHILFNEDIFKGDIDIERWLISDIESKFCDNISISDSKNKLKHQIIDWHYQYSGEYSEIRKLHNNLWWRLHAYKIKNINNDKILKPLIVFDQFEEVFIKGTKQFLNSLFSIIEQISSSTLPASVSIVIEELEEFDDLEIDRLHDFKILFSLRKDFLSDFDYWSNDKYSITELFQNRMLLNALSRKQAKQVICDQEGVGTLNEVANEIIEKIDDKHHDAVEPFILSVFCSRLFAKAISINKEILKKEDLAQIDIKNIIRSFYEEKIFSLITDEEHRFTFETSLVDEDGFRKRERIASRKLASIEFEKNYAESLEDSHLIRIITINDAKCVEIVHDRIAEVISERNKQRESEKNAALEKAEKRKLQEEAENNRKLLLQEQEIQRKKDIESRKLKNINRYLNSTNVLTLKGRRIWNNKSFAFSADNNQSNSLQDSFTGFDTDFTKLNNNLGDNLGELFLDQLLIQIAGQDCVSLDFQDNCSKDGISKLVIHTTLPLKCTGRRKIKSVVFYDEDSTKYLNTQDGFYGIELLYGEDGREIERKYLCDDFTSVGIVSIKFEYNSDGLPISAMYFDKFGIPCKHRDGNYGVLMEYDDFGNETCRWFVDAAKHITSIYNGVCGVISSYDDMDRIVGQYFVDENKQRKIDFYDCHGVKYEYGEKHGTKIVRIYQIDIFNNFVENSNGYCIEEDWYDNNNRVVVQWYFDKNNSPVERLDGTFSYSCIEITYDDNGNPVQLTLKDKDGNIVTNSRYEYYANGLIAKQFFKDGKSVIDVNDRLESHGYFGLSSNGVFEQRFEYTNQGLICRLSNWNNNGVLIQDSNGISAIDICYDDFGRISSKKFYKKILEYPEEINLFEYFSDGTCKVRCLLNIIEEEKSPWYRFVRLINRSSKHKYRIENTVTDSEILGVFNSRYDLVELHLDVNNEIIPGTSIKVQKRFNIEGEVIENRYFDLSTGLPICDNEGAYGMRVKTSSHGSSTVYLDSTFSIGNNIHGYAIVEHSSEDREGNVYQIESYFNKFHEPVLSEFGFHKKETSSLEGYDQLQNFEFFDTLGNPINNTSGYQKQKCEVVESNNGELKSIVCYFDANGVPTINKEVGFHKRIEVKEESSNYFGLRIYLDSNGNLIDCPLGYAKMKMKRNTSLLTYFHYPFEDYDVLRFYDSKDNKVEVDYHSSNDQKIYRGYKIITPTDSDVPLSTYSVNSNLLYRRSYDYWKYIVYPPLYFIAFVLFVILFPIIYVYDIVIKSIKGRKKMSSASCSVIKISEFVEDENGFCPLRNLDVKLGTWIIEWNDWKYSTDGNSVNCFESEFNKRAKNKTILLYDPEGVDPSTRFKRVRFVGNVGARIVDSEVNRNCVGEMLEILHNCDSVAY